MLSISRAIVEPRKLVLIDEPTKGLAPAIINNLIEAFAELKKTDTTILMVEQNFHAAQSLGDSVAVMDAGRIVHSRPHGRPRRRRGAADAPARPVAGGAPVSRSPARVDWIPPALLLAIALGALALIGNPSTWVTLTVAGLAMGLLIFIMSSGLTLVFGLMDVMNFAHGLFIAVGAYVAASTIKLFSAAAGADSFLANLGALAAGDAGRDGGRRRCSACSSSASSSGRCTAQHLKQILITTGGMIVAEQLIHVLWGPDLLPLPRPATLRGSFLIGDMAIEKYRLVAVVRRPGGVRRHAAACSTAPRSAC